MARLSVSAPAPVGGSIHVNVVLNGYSPTGSLAAFLTPPGDTFCSGTPVFSPTFEDKRIGQLQLSQLYPDSLGVVQVAGHV